ncbi:right-handed parallel beta-helix repeat-containing protein [Dyadobacter endophyticus]|uniref:right-handed parallel beta-helix repeat-containing protein n=1 Tax=Dyadobacter endophyticus TaxID=1749036 RepID=UPI001663460B|nr:right-handed parallel beta-helix repeat-containing protein [Dyadobacter endophyticus]
MHITDDGKEGLFRYSATDVSSVDDSAMVIRSGSRRYLRVIRGAVNAKWFGAKGDGTTDDYSAIARAVAYVGKKSQSLFLPKGVYYLKLKASLALAAGVNMYGEAGTVLNLDTTTPVYTSFASNIGDNVTISNLEINRIVDRPFVFFMVQSFKGFTFRNLKINGNRARYANFYCHAFQMGVNNAGVSENVTIDSCSIMQTSYGLFMTNASTAVVKNVTVSNCMFDSNTSTDLEFNSPNGSFSSVSVDNCRFSNGRLFAVGFANVKSAKVKNCFFERYDKEPVHIEDYSEDISIESNSFKSCALNVYAYVQIISGSRRVRVSNNTFDASANAAATNVMSALAGGLGSTGGGRKVIPPRSISFLNNDVLLSSVVNGLYVEAVTNFTISGNKFRGPGGVTSGVFNGASNYAIRVYASQFGVISDNNIRGINSGISSPPNNVNGLSEGQVVSGNSFSDCLVGIAGYNLFPSTISQNTFTQCQFPMFTGAYSSGVPKNLVITGNSAIRCSNPFLIYNYVNVRATSAVTSGSDKTVSISPLPGVFPQGTVITFASGAVLTLTKAAAFQATKLTGNITVSNILANDTATVYRRYSSDVKQTQTVFKNIDDFYGRSGSTLIKEVHADYQVVGYEETIIITANAPTIKLPPAISWNTKEITVKNSSARNATVSHDGVKDTLKAGTSVGYRLNDAGSAYIKMN